jgi:hypothetical protein
MPVRDLAQILAHAHDQEIEIAEDLMPPPREWPVQ